MSSFMFDSLAKKDYGIFVQKLKRCPIYKITK